MATNVPKARLRAILAIRTMQARPVADCVACRARQACAHSANLGVYGNAQTAEAGWRATPVLEWWPKNSVNQNAPGLIVLMPRHCWTIPTGAAMVEERLPLRPRRKAVIIAEWRCSCFAAALT